MDGLRREAENQREQGANPSELDTPQLLSKLPELYWDILQESTESVTAGNDEDLTTGGFTYSFSFLKGVSPRFVKHAQSQRRTALMRSFDNRKANQSLTASLPLFSSLRT